MRFTSVLFRGLILGDADFPVHLMSKRNRAMLLERMMRSVSARILII
jgi:hypothetical protein